MARVEWGGFVDNARLVPRPADPRTFGSMGPPTPLLPGSGERDTTSDCWQYTRKPIGYRLVAAANLRFNQ